MRLAVLSDIHGNLEAFREVLRDMDAAGHDDAVCLGDNVGYGPEPEAVVRMVQSRGISSVMGNHEFGLCDAEARYSFNPNAYAALERTRQLLGKKTLEALAGFPRVIVRHGARFVHGMPPEFIHRYLWDVPLAELGELFGRYPERMCFVGHTHELGLVRFDGERAEHLPLEQGVARLDPHFRWMVNAGSVGQPRDGNNNAKYVIWDTEEHTVEARFVPYDFERTARRIVEVGLPRRYADRLR